jgi:glycerol uptake facilitator-like aquaporin
VNSPNSPVNPVPGTLAAEAAGTFMLTFAGTATVLAVHQLQKGSTGTTVLDDLTIGTAFAFGLIAAVYAVAGLSGAHLNPAITMGLAAVGQFPWRMVPGYVAAQMTGALLAGLANWVIFPHLREPLILGSTHPGPGIAWWTAGFTEFVITLILMVVVMATAVIVAMEFPYWWIYVAGPVLGGMAGAALWELVLNQGRQPAAGQASGLSHRLPANRPLVADGTLQQGRVHGGRFTVDGGPADCSMARSAPSKPGSCPPRLTEPRRLLHKVPGSASPARGGGGGPVSVRGCPGQCSWTWSPCWKWRWPSWTWST